MRLSAKEAREKAERKVSTEHILKMLYACIDLRCEKGYREYTLYLGSVVP